MHRNVTIFFLLERDCTSFQTVKNWTFTIKVNSQMNYPFPFNRKIQYNTIQEIYFILLPESFSLIFFSSGQNETCLILFQIVKTSNKLCVTFSYSGCNEMLVAQICKKQYPNNYIFANSMLQSVDSFEMTIFVFCCQEDNTVVKSIDICNQKLDCSLGIFTVS